MEDMQSVGGLPANILEYIRQHGPCKAKQVAVALGVERQAVNAALYGPLRGKVWQDKSYCWSEAAEGSGATRSTENSSNSWASLFAYYLDCLAQDDNAGVQTFADSKFNLDYVELSSWPLDGPAPDSTSDALRSLIARQRRDARKKTLWLGYPVLIQYSKNRSGWQGAFVVPLLLWPQDQDSETLDFHAEAMANIRALQRMPESGEAMLEAVHLAEELGLGSGEVPPLDELTARLKELRPYWPWKEALAPAPFRPEGDLRAIADTGIYNAAVVVLADRSPFTVGLEKELAGLQSVSGTSISESSLGILLGAPGSSGKFAGPILEPSPLNAEQRMAVQQALTEPLTVITGPPGTGKSQVVTDILVNAAWRGQRALFASKNNKAVDVVMQRFNALSPGPVLLRLGSRALQQELATHITTILSSRTTDDDRRAYDKIVEQLEAKTEAIDDLARRTAQIVEQRNNADRREQEAEAARPLLSPDMFASADRLSLTTFDARLDDTRIAIRRADRTQAPVLIRLMWMLFRRARERALQAACAALRSESALVGLGVEANLTPEQSYARGIQLRQAIRSAAAYNEARRALSSNNDLGSLSAELAEQNKSLATLSAEAWSTWTSLLPDRLNARDRIALGDYASVLRIIGSAENTGSQVANEVWRRYYELAGQTTKALPCWAVTSLSARGRIPLTSGEFDLLVLDEASQCDIASALPLFYRAKRAVVIGDPQQLRHICRLSAQQDQALLVNHKVIDSPGPTWGYRANSVYDLAAAKVNASSIVVLRDHHRSHADIIEFSNRFFYKNQLRVATNYGLLKRPDGPAIRWINVTGTVFRPPGGGALNREEARAVVEELRRLMVNQRFAGTIGVVTPFRAQANYIEELISGEELLSPVLAAHDFISETSHKFQGDERDVIVFSPVVSTGTPASAVGFLQSQGNIFNVGITRARGALVVVGDAAGCASCEISYLSAFAKYVVGLDKRSVAAASAAQIENNNGVYPKVAHPERVSDWERLFYSALLKSGIRTIPQYDVDQYDLDLALVRPNGRRLDIEIDGERYHRDWDGELMRRDQLRNLRLIEMGWDVMRFWVYEVRDDRPRCIERVHRWAQAADVAPAVAASSK